MVKRNPTSCHDYYRDTSREWGSCENFFNIIVLTFASRTYYIGLFVVSILRFTIDALESFAVYLYIHLPVNAHDEKLLFEGLKPVREMKYGDHFREYLFHLAPKEEPSVRKTLVYIHGGGFVAANAGVLIQSITGFIRKGYDMYSVNYSLDPFPAGIVSLLKMLNYVYVTEGVYVIGIFGDSAGANLAIQAAICSSNPDLLQRLSKLANQPELKEMVFPKIKVCACINGMLDRAAIAERRLTSIYYLENLFMLLMCQFCLWMYESRLSEENSRDWGVNIPFTKVKKLPPTIIVAGRQDPLIASSWLVFQKLQKAGFSVEFKTYQGRHIFFGFPTWALLGNWKVAAQPCLYDLCDFFRMHLDGSAVTSC